MAELPATEPNRLLASLDRSDRAALVRAGEQVQLTARQSLAYPREPMSHAYFPRGAVLSMLVPMENGLTVEGATVGLEGMLGLHAGYGDGVGSEEWICQIAGDALRIEASAFKQLVTERLILHATLDEYGLAFMSQIARTAGCNGAHPVPERCARWILMTSDRVASETFPLTHEFLALMLGVRRASVTVAANHLQSKGLIRYSRGVMTIVDRRGLEKAACEDYPRSKEAYEHLFQRLKHRAARAAADERVTAG